MTEKKSVVIANLIDWSESFVDENGSFYCGTTVEQKERAAQLLSLADLVVNNTDLHPVTAPEHVVNGGLYPVHNAINPEKFSPDFIYLITPEGKEIPLGDKTLSPRLTSPIATTLKDRKSGLMVPREVYFQTPDGNPFCQPGDIEETFRQGVIEPNQFLDSHFNYITAPKKYFDATRSDNDLLLPQKRYPQIPDRNINIYTLIKVKYPAPQFNLVMINTGVVEGICRLHTSIGMKQMFPNARIINISDATTPLFGVGLGYQTPEESRQASMQVCRDVGIEYMTAAECKEEIEKLY